MARRDVPEDLIALFRAKDLDTLIDGTFRVLAAAVDCDFVSTIYGNAGNGLLKERDSLGRESAPAFMRRYAELTPAIAMVLSNRGIRILTTRVGLPGPTSKLRRTAFYREIMRPQGWRHGVTLCFWGDKPAQLPILVTVAYRREGRRDFSAHDVQTLERLHPFIDCAVNRVCEREAAETLHHGMVMTAGKGPEGYAILDANLGALQTDRLARQLCAAWVDDGVETDTANSSLAWRLPPALEAQCRELHDEWQALVRTNPDAFGVRRRRQVAHPAVPGLTALITIVGASTTGLLEPTFVLEFVRRVHGVPLDAPDRSLPIMQSMTTAERAVALVLADGFSNQEIADRLGKSVNAVKFLLHRIYVKSGVPNRAALVAVLRPHRKSRLQSGRIRTRRRHGSTALLRRG
jgi:DNA-binding CsgD family transcriptional regulator